MKILAIYGDEAPIDLWRVKRPLEMLKANMPDWTVAHQDRLVMHAFGMADTAEYTENELEVAAARLGKYDIVYLSYFTITAMLYTLMCVITQRHGTQFVIDVDDNIFAINEDNPIWLTVGHDQIHDLQTIMRDSPWLTTTGPELAHVLRNRRPEYKMGSTGVIPNFISDVYQHPPIKHDDKVVIGYFGGTSHFADLNESGFPKALRDIMKKYKQVHFRAAGVPLDIPMPASRESFVDGKRGEAWAREIFPTLGMDIAVAPLLDNLFNAGKSNIKWQEATRMGAAVVASNLGPYKPLSDAAIRKVGNTRAEWYDALEELLSPAKRKAQVEAAQANLFHNWRLEDHWQLYRDYFEFVRTASSPLAGNML